MLFTPKDFFNILRTKCDIDFKRKFYKASVISLCDYHSPDQAYVISNVSNKSDFIKYKIRGVRCMIKCLSFMRLNKKKYYFIKKLFLNIFFSIFEQRKFLIF